MILYLDIIEDVQIDPANPEQPMEISGIPVSDRADAEAKATAYVSDYFVGVPHKSYLHTHSHKPAIPCKREDLGI